MGVVAEDSPMTSKTFNPKTAPGHQVLAAAGKTILRPGGTGGQSTVMDLG